MPKIVLDQHQLIIQKALKQLAKNLEENSNNNLIAKIFSSKTKTQSFYIYGDVGRGKSMLMKEFFTSISKTPKLYFHFNGFMRQIHEALRDIRKEDKKFKDELIEAVERIIVCYENLVQKSTAPDPSLSRRGEQQNSDLSPSLLSGGEPKSPSLLSGGEPKSPSLLRGGEPKSPSLLRGGEPKSPSLLRGGWGGARHAFALKAKLICLDEFQVTDIADAMLLSRIFSYLFSKNTTIIFTSNSKPTNLYKNGLQREIFLEFVTNILLKNCQVLNLNSPTDYRAEYTKNLTKRYFINNQKNRQTIKEIINNLTNQKPPKPTKLNVWGREVIIKKTYNNIAVINFKDLCQTDHSASDYQNICQRFSLIFLFNLPKLTQDNLNEAKRFMLFIDEIYENKTALIITAKVKIDEIYNQGIGSEPFKRTQSRLQEIKSDNYWQASKINFLK